MTDFAKQIIYARTFFYIRHKKTWGVIDDPLMFCSGMVVGKSIILVPLVQYY